MKFESKFGCIPMKKNCTCKCCGKTYHEFTKEQINPCNIRHKCKNCGKEEWEEPTHIWRKSKILNPCTTIEICTQCQSERKKIKHSKILKETEMVEDVDHPFGGGCKDSGKTTYKCEECGAISYSDTIENCYYIPMS